MTWPPAAAPLRSAVQIALPTFSDVDPRTRYEFRKPLWRRILPFLALLVVWTVPLLLSRRLLPGTDKLWEQIADGVIRWLEERGITFRNSVIAASGVSVPLVLWWYWGFEKLIVTTTNVTRCFPGIRLKPLDWNDVDEIFIEHTEHRFEGRDTAYKLLRIYSVRPPLEPWRRCLRVSNRQYDAYHHVERLAALVSIPAIAARKRAEMSHRGRPARFGLREPGHARRTMFIVLLAAVLLAAWGYDRVWQIHAMLAPARLWAFAGGLVMLMWGLLRLPSRAVLIDADNLTIERRFRGNLVVPIDSITEAKTDDNETEIWAMMGKHPKARRVLRTGRYFHNRAVLLYMIRETLEARKAEDARPIVDLERFE